MTVIASAQDASGSRRHHTLENGATYFRTNYMTSSPDSPHNPMCYLVEQDPDCTIKAHYHQANQFQVFVGGSGALGKRELQPLIVHYVDAFTPYGPIVSRKDGVHYLTLREEYDPGARFLPEQVAGLKHVKRRHVTTEPARRSPGSALPGLTGAHVRALFETHADGLAASLIAAGPQAAVQDAPGARIPCSQFWLILEGSVTHSSATLESNTYIYVHHAEPAPQLSAGPRGAEVLMLQFPKRVSSGSPQAERRAG